MESHVSRMFYLIHLLQPRIAVYECFLLTFYLRCLIGTLYNFNGIHYINGGMRNETESTYYDFRNRLHGVCYSGHCQCL